MWPAIAELFAHFFEERLRGTHAGAAALADAELCSQRIQVVGAALDGFADLRLGDTVTDADVHAQILMQMRTIRNQLDSGCGADAR